MMDAYEAWERHDAEQEKWLQKRPACCQCGEHIQEEHLYDIDGEVVCDDCLRNYIDKHYRQPTERYM